MPLILIIDDDPDILKVLRANLQVAGFGVETGLNCSEAGDLIEKNQPDLLVLDLMLPDCDGVEFCRELRERGMKFPIIMLTARDDLSDRVLGLESGADDYVVKPFEAMELIARIRACLRRRSPSKEECLETGEILVDISRRHVTVRGEVIDLTPKEFDLLCLFIRNGEKVLTRDFIRKSLWKDSRRLYSWSRVIDVHVQHLRAKIERDPAAPEYILTVPGVRYRFVPKEREEA